MLQTPGLKEVFAAIEAAGGEARIVGGAVRNALLDEPVREIDIATTLEPDATMAAAALRRAGARTPRALTTAR
jgi:poly(A) polymerase